MARIIPKVPFLFLFFSVVRFETFVAQGFFIDLEALGFTSGNKQEDEASSASVLIAQPSEPEYVEVESKSEPGKSVRLTIEELKELILGSVKDITSKPQPINIKISTEGRQGQRPQYTTPAPTTTTQPPPPPPKYKYKSSSSESYSHADLDDGVSYWNHSPSIEYDTSDDDRYSNEVTGSKGSSSSSEKNSSGLMSVYKTVFKTPSYILNSYSKQFNRWRGKKQPAPPMKKHQPQRRRPIQDITYQHNPRDRRRRRKNKPMQQRRRPRPRPQPQPQQRRRYHQQHQQKRPSTYSDYDYADSEYEDFRRPTYAEAWDRMDIVGGQSSSGDFDSNLPGDDTEIMNMSPPRPYVM